ncbi:MAG: hypothetical protein QOC95_2545 [Thermoleophilaceae bacterium]|jgi:hypothetical protein|nr:hypothetical protein [Thermoleophilaceae bacterium]
MNSPTLVYKFGPAGGLAAERPSITDLQRAQRRALRQGDRRRAGVYALLVRRRVEAAQEALRDAA